MTDVWRKRDGSNVTLRGGKLQLVVSSLWAMQIVSVEYIRDNQISVSHKHSTLKHTTHTHTHHSSAISYLYVLGLYTYQIEPVFTTNEKRRHSFSYTTTLLYFIDDFVNYYPLWAKFKTCSFSIPHLVYPLVIG